MRWPLTDKEVESLNRNCRHLGEVLSTESEFVDMLFTNEVINERQKNFINARKNNVERNEAFLDILRRFSLNAYFLVTKYLRASKQELIANILEEGGGELHRVVDWQVNIRGSQFFLCLSVSLASFRSRARFSELACPVMMPIMIRHLLKIINSLWNSVPMEPIMSLQVMDFILDECRILLNAAYAYILSLTGY